MKTNAVDLRYSMKEVMRSLELNEPVTLYYHGKEKAMIVPIEQTSECSVTSLKFFGMRKDDKRSVDAVMDDLRGGRFRDL
jgi:antitoxin (DNA-binding transcriptional repressor) of toxin-antitoxin stability system